VKIGFSANIKEKDVNSGKHRFFIRLAKCFEEQGINVSSSSPDIFLMNSNDKRNTKAKVNILRLDGLILNSEQKYKIKNKKIVNNIKKCDAIVYQSTFCKNAYRKFLKIKKEPYAIIHNGADSYEFLPRSAENFILANCKWRPHKRLNDIVKSFIIALDMGLDSDLVITGKPDSKIKKHKRIRYIGWQQVDELKILLSKAICTVHLTWLDWCPNAMIESIMAGCPLIYTKSGGHIELGSGSGIGIDDQKWDFKPCKLYSPPKIDRRKVAEAMLSMKNEGMKTDKKRFDIVSIAKQYYEYFLETLSK